MLTEHIKKITELTDAEIDTMWHLMNSYYNNITRETFLSDLHDKEGTLLITSEDSTIRGFSTYKLIHSSHEGEKITVLFSGDTIVDHNYWGRRAGFRVFGTLLKTILEDYNTKKYWLLISKGYRTYLLLPLFFKNYYPNYRDNLPIPEKKLLTSITKLTFPGYSFEDRGVIKLNPQADYLKETFSTIPENRTENKNVRYFLEKNPLYTEGQELVCLAEITANNFTRVFTSFIFKEK